MRVLPQKSVIGRWLFFFMASMLVFVSGIAQASTQPYITDHQINFGTGNKYLTATDVSGPGPGPRLSFTRTYNSQSSETSVIGYGWTTSLTEKLIIGTGEIILVQSGGRYVLFTDDGSGNWINETGARRVISSVSGGYQLLEKTGTTKQFDSSGLLLSYADKNNNTRTYSYSGSDLTAISNNFGRSISFGYTADKLNSVTSDIGTVTYGYDANDNLVTVTKPDTTTITYVYDDPNDIHNLTGVINEENVRILTVEYDTSDRVTRSAKTGGANEVTISYPANYMREITNSLGVKTTYFLDVLHGIIRVGSFTGPGCSSCGSISEMSYLYDDRLRVKQATDAKGTITSYTYDDNGNTLTKRVAVDTPLEKTTTYTYTATNQVETVTVDSIANLGQQSVTTNSYDGNGNLLSRVASGYAATLPISATTSYAYNGYGQLSSIDGPRTDVNDLTTLSYYANDAGEGNNSGNLHTVTNAFGHIITYSDYNVHGQAETITDGNGLITTRSFDSHGRLLSSTTAGLTTGYSYNDAGELLGISLPGNRVITYSYNTAGRVEKITDTDGNSISYSYDSEGKKIGEQVNDPAASLQRIVNFEYDDAGRLSKVLLPGNAEQSASYDEVGNLVTTINATNLQSDMDYDALNRLQAITEDGSSTGYSYDANGNISQVTDAKGKNTTFSYDDLGQQLSRTAPDSGVTLYSYDEAGNLSTITDALSRIVGIDYDQLNRPVSQFYGSSEILFTYDQNPDGIGRLSSITDEHGSRSFLYTGLGQLASETRLIGSSSYTTSYDYTVDTGELDSVTYPSGRVVAYNHGTDGQVESITIDGGTIISAVTHLPFGPLKSATLGSVELSKSYDQRYNLEAIQAGALNYTYTRDAEGHVSSIANLPPPTVTNLTEDYTYDLANNQLSQRSATSYIYDAVGNMLSDGVHTFTYNELNHITQVEKDGQVIATYGYDSSNRRISKTTGGTTIHYHYDNNSQLIAETLADGTPLRDYIYLNGEPIALNEYQNNPGLYYYLNDHLGTPQQLVTGSGAIVWQAAYLPFGKAQVTIEQVVNNIRFLGQYYDAETGLHYNWHRFYDPETGRYISADPIGLAGGMNLYAYVGGDPVNLVDPLGLVYSGYEHGNGAVPERQDGFTHGWEFHLIVGVGQFQIKCCDEGWNEELIHTYRKICLGAAIDASYGVGYTSGMSGSSCSNPPKKLLGAELGALIVEGGVSVDMDGSGAGGSGGGSGGFGIGGVKATGCFYFYVSTEYTGKKCKCE